MPATRSHTRNAMITHLSSIGGGFEQKLAIAPQSALGQNWFTIFLAENGGRKSYLLRCLTEAALGSIRYTPERGRSIQLHTPDELPDRVIAISGTPLDRFPRAGTRDLKSRRRRYKDNFVYLGPRASNGMAGVAQSERSFVGSLISNRHLLNERAKLLKRAFSLLNLHPYVEVFLAVVPGKEPRLTPQEEDTLHELEELGLTEREDLRKALNEMQAHSSEILDTLSQTRKRSVSIKFGINTETRYRKHGLTLGIWELLLRIGRVEVSSTQFHKLKNQELISGEQLSSGQWGWLGTFGSLVAEIRHNSLILVDEPENSLHPRWQQEFIRELHAIVSEFHNCQVVVATHSPLIASGVSQEWGSIRTLSRPRRAGAYVRSQELPTAFGWSASDVYDGPFGLSSTRAPDFLEIANTALRELSAGAAIDPNQRNQWIEQITENCNALPQLDPMRDVLESIIRRLSTSTPTHAVSRKGRA